MTKHNKLNYQSIGDRYYDIYCQPETITKQKLLMDIADILNGKLTKQDYIKEIKQWK